MTTVKVFKAGNSLAVTLPQELVLRLNIRAGDRVIPQLDETRIAYTPIKQGSVAVATEFKSWLKSFEKKHSRALAELARK